MTRLLRARHENRLELILQQLTYPKVLVLDEIGYLPLGREESSLFFRLLVRRYERASMIVTSNKSFIDWGDIFNDQVPATAILDRLLHHATTLNIKGESYRLKEKRRAGLLSQPSARSGSGTRGDRVLNGTSNSRIRGHLSPSRLPCLLLLPFFSGFEPVVQPANGSGNGSSAAGADQIVPQHALACRLGANFEAMSPSQNCADGRA
jgi:IstB-like ATP binding protein